MNKEFVSYEQALALKELGFDEPCFAKYYQQDGNTPFIQIGESEIEEAESAGNDITFECDAPLYQQAFRWFREKDYYSEIRVGCTQIDGGIGYEWWVWKPNGIEEWSIQMPGEEWSYETYEESEQACLDKLIEIVKNKTI